MSKPKWAIPQYKNEAERISIEWTIRGKWTLAKLYMKDIVEDDGTYLLFDRMTTGGGFKGVGSDASEPLWLYYLTKIAVLMDHHNMMPENVETIYDFLEQRRSRNISLNRV